MVLNSSFKLRKKDDDLSKLIVEGLGSEPPELKNRQGRLYASDSVLCHKKGVLKSTRQVYEQSDALMSYYVEQGITAERVTLKGLDNAGVLLFENYRLPDIGINLGGYVDGIIYYKGKVWVLEVKQIGSLPASPKKEHEAQAMLYGAVTGLPSLILYLDRKVAGWNTGLLTRVFELDNSYDNRFKFLYRAVLASQFVKNKVIPKKPDYMKKSYCGRCPFFDRCWEGSEDYNNWLKQGFRNSDLTDEQEYSKIATKITKDLLNQQVMQNRTIGVLKFIFENGRENAKKHLSGSWSEFC